MSAVRAALFRPLPFNFRPLLLIRPPIKFKSCPIKNSCTNVPLPRKLRLFVKEKMSKIPVSEAAVERYFSAHKRIHTPMWASLHDEIVDDLLYIRYNHQSKYGKIYQYSDIESDANLDLIEFE